MEKKVADAEGYEIKMGDTVVLITLPPELIAGLPTKDVRAIASQVDQKMTVLGFDPYGNVELDFESSDGTLHTIFVSGIRLRKELS
jgi:hypothetical protein